MRLIIAFLFIILVSCSGVSSYHKTKKGFRVCVSPKGEINEIVSQSFQKVLKSNKLTEYKQRRGGDEVRGFKLVHQYHKKHSQEFTISYQPVEFSGGRGYLFIGATSGDSFKGFMQVKDVVKEVYSKCGEIVTDQSIKFLSYETYFQEELLADGKTWEVRTSATSKLKSVINKRAIDLCGKKFKVFACAAYADNPMYKNKCYVKCE